jgi:2-oxo-3-hexenedioate decarboxylase
VTTVDVGKWANYLFEAERRCEAVSPITDIEPDLTVDEAYEIQDELLARRLDAGERIVGAKVGLTSRAKQEDMGISEPIFGWLTDAMMLTPEQPLRLRECIHPRVEPEIVFVLGERLDGPGVGVHDALGATSAVCGGMEVIDSRFVDFRFGLPDVVSDNTSACRFLLGTALAPPTDFDISLLGCLLEVGGTLLATAAGAAVLGHPAVALAELANFLGRRGKHLEPGWVVLSGGLTAAVPLEPGSHVNATFAHLGSVQMRAEG